MTAAALRNQAVPKNLVSGAYRGKRQALAWFNWLAGLEAGGELDPTAALRDYMTRARYPGPLLLLSDLLGPGWESGLRALAGRRFEVTVLHLLSPQEVSPSLEGDVRLVDSENSAAVEITADYDLLQRYRARLTAWQERLRQTCAAIGAHYVFMESSGRKPRRLRRGSLLIFLLLLISRYCRS